MQVNLTLASSMNTCSCIIKLKTVWHVYWEIVNFRLGEFHCFILFPLKHNCVFNLGEFMIWRNLKTGWNSLQVKKGKSNMGWKKSSVYSNFSIRCLFIVILNYMYFPSSGISARFEWVVKKYKKSNLWSKI